MHKHCAALVVDCVFYTGAEDAAEYRAKRELYIRCADRHCNSQYEFHILLSGTSLFNVEGHIYALKAGDAIIVAPGQYHCGYQASKDFRRFTLGFRPEAGFLETQLRQFSKNENVLFLQQNTLQLCRNIIEQLCNQGAFQMDILRVMCMQLMIHLFREMRLQSPDTAYDSESLDVVRTNIIDCFFSMNAIPMGTEEELARRLNISRRQLNRVLVQHYGMGFREKMLETRMEYAGWLLRTTNYKMSKIASMVGYTADTTFYKAFKNYFSITPRQYRGEIMKSVGENL